MTPIDYSSEKCHALDRCEVRDGRSLECLRIMDDLCCISDPTSCIYCNSQRQEGDK